MSVDGEASLSLRFAIVGAGIAGLAAAYRLRQAGHEVCVLEKRDGPTWGRNSVCCPPNMTRILYQWGLRSKLVDVALKRKGITFRHCETGQPIAEYKYYDWIVKDLGADYLFMKHRDLYEILYGLAVSTGVKIRFGANVVGIDPWTPSVSLSSGEIVKADIIVGADGLGSVVRGCMAESLAESRTDVAQGGRIRPLFMAAATLDKEDMATDGELGSLLSTPMANLWMGQRQAVWGCPLPHDRGYSLMVALPPNGCEVGEEYNREYGTDRIQLDFSSFEPRLQKMIKRIKSFYPVLWKARRPLPSLVHDSKKVVLLGEAAHPIPPNMTQNTALAIEDAAVFSNLFSRINYRAEINRFVSAYHEIRYPRALDVVYSEMGNMCLISGMEHPYGEQLREQDVRTPTVVGIQDDALSPEFMWRWDEMIRMFNHDVNDDVDEWWHTWGSLMNRDKEGSERLMRDSGGLISERRTALVRQASRVMVETN